MSWFSRAAGDSLRAGQLLSGNAKAMLVPEEIGFPVQFSFNPTKVALSRNAKNQGNQTTMDNPLSAAVKETAPVTIQLSGALLTGAVVTQAAVDQLLSWSEPKPTANLASRFGQAVDLLRRPGRIADTVRNTVSNAVNDIAPGFGGSGPTPPPTFVPAPGATASSSYQLPVLLFLWGVGGPMGNGAKVQIVSVSVDYKRFDWTGVPVMASVDLTLEAYQPEPPFTNPTSGGIPGRSKHVLTQGENVVRVATRTYGSPAAWRAVAEANDLDDPLRVRPGRELHLPGPGELGHEEVPA
ncbi:LysM peptidoglycan-binding domain-containing protein [Amycolatopsis magusensis]|uniref:LysM peptidoglycan-binding domain-containing protein n=1 Tax=Amycolatopsis magusensis TaxID=882444 RepID=UPI0024A8B6A8|nr:hypothetical protein [Amycolatopsis magusensis]MDI5979520.1 hypothetical protein [Amycolatopsis magusensis]